MERLRARDNVCGAVRQRDLLCAAAHRDRPGHGDPEPIEHLLERLDRRHAMPERDERACQLARSRAEVDDVARLVAREPAHRVVGVSRAGTLVGIRHRAERGGAHEAFVSLCLHPCERILVGVRHALLAIAVCLLLAGCGGGSNGASSRTDDPLSYDGGAPLDVQHGTRSERDGVVVEDVSYASGDDRVEGYLVSPSSTSGKVPAVVFLHGAGDDREEQLDTAVKLAKRDAIALTITAPSGAKTPPAGATGEALVRWQGGTISDDVIAARRGFDVLADDDRVDADRLGLFGWSMGGRLAALVAGVDDRVRATVLMSAGAAPVDAYVEGAPAELQDVVREVLEPIDPLTRIDDAKGKVLVQAGRQDSIVPRAALEAVIEAAPKGTKVEWYEADHALNDQAETDRLDWLSDQLGLE